MSTVSLGDKQVLHGDCNTRHYSHRQEYVEPAVWDTLSPEEKGGMEVNNLVLWRRGDIIGLEKFEHRAAFVQSRKHRVVDHVGETYYDEWDQPRAPVSMRQMRLWVTSYKAMNDLYFNLKTGFWYLKRKRFMMKPGAKRRSLVSRGIQRNPVRYLDGIDGTFSTYHESEPAWSLAVALGLNPHPDELATISISEVIWRWFTGFHGIKYSDNWKAHTKYYPLMSNIRKCGMNLTRAILYKEGVLSKLTNKLLNEKFDEREEYQDPRPHVPMWECVDPEALIWWARMLGDLFPNLALHHLRRISGTHLDGTARNLPWFVADINVGDFTRQEKLRITRCSQFAREPELRDHVAMHVRLRQSGVPVVWRANNQRQFNVEHEAWSELMGRTRRAPKELEFMPEMVDLIEDHDYEGWKAVILKTSEDYHEEGSYQKHCVGGYIDYVLNSFIISLRHPDGTRITNEVGYDGKIRQTRGKCNDTSGWEYKGMQQLATRLDHIIDVYYDPLPKPEVITLKNHEVDNYLKGLDQLVEERR